MISESELEHASNMADARLGVAEQFSYPLAFFVALAAHFKWESWLLSVPVFGIVFWLSVRSYRKASNEAEDAYYKAAKLGKYSKAMSLDDESPD